MRFSRRQFFHASSGALAFGSCLTLLKGAGIADTQPIKVGNILDKTGGLNIYCLKQITAAAMAVDELNSAGGLLGRQVELIFYDSQSNNQLNSQYATQAFVRDKVDVMHGGVTSSSREVMRPIVDRYKGLYFYNSLYEGGVCDRRHVCTGMVPAQQIEPLVDYVVGEKGAKKGYILAADYNYGQITAKWMQKFIRERGGQDVAVEFFPLDVTNFAPVISRIQAAKPDVVWSALVGDAHMSFYRQFEATIGKKNMMLACGTYGVGRENATLSPQENEGIIIATSFIDTLPTEAAKSLRRRSSRIFRPERVCRRVRRIWLPRHDAVGGGGQEGRKRPSRRRDRGARRHHVQRGGRALQDRRRRPTTRRWTSISAVGNTTRASTS